MSQALWFQALSKYATGKRSDMNLSHALCINRIGLFFWTSTQAIWVLYFLMQQCNHLINIKSAEIVC
jgi:hypothetical protein